MTNQRWKELNDAADPRLTADEVIEGWHFCLEFDGLLVGPGSSELKFCKCWPDEHAVYKTTPKDLPDPISNSDL